MVVIGSRPVRLCSSTWATPRVAGIDGMDIVCRAVVPLGACITTEHFARNSICIVFSTSLHLLAFVSCVCLCPNRKECRGCEVKLAPLHPVQGCAAGGKGGLRYRLGAEKKLLNGVTRHGGLSISHTPFFARACAFASPSNASATCVIVLYDRTCLQAQSTRSNAASQDLTPEECTCGRQGIVMETILP